VSWPLALALALTGAGAGAGPVAPSVSTSTGTSPATRSTHAVCELRLTEHRSGRELKRLPLDRQAPEIRIAFEHSVLGTTVIDRYRFTPAPVLVEEEFEGEGYGLPAAPGPGEWTRWWCARWPGRACVCCCHRATCCWPAWEPLPWRWRRWGAVPRHPEDDPRPSTSTRS